MMNVQELYANYQEERFVEIPLRELFLEENGIPNRIAFYDFTEQISEEDNLFLIALSLDLSDINKSKGFQAGNRVMRQFCHMILSGVESAFIFRLQGEKFNILCHKEQLEVLKELLDKEASEYRVYYAVSSQPFELFSAEEIIADCKTRMYEDRKRKTKSVPKLAAEPQPEVEPVSSVSDARPIAVSANPEIQEDSDISEAEAMFKFGKELQDIWYVRMSVEIENPRSSCTIFAFPTRICKPNVSVPLVVALFDLVDFTDVLYGKNVDFDINGIPFYLNIRFDNKNDMNVMLYSTNKNVKTKIKIEEIRQTPEFPKTFGLKIGKTGEKIFPLMKSVTGAYQYIKLSADDTVTINTEGDYQVEGVHYFLSRDTRNGKEYIGLIDLDNGG